MTHTTTEEPKWRRPMERGDAVEVADRVAERYMIEGGAPLAFDAGSWWRHSAGIWHKVSQEELINALRALAGAPVFSREDKNGEAKYRPLRVNGFTAALEALRAACWSWDQGNGFFADAPAGVAFADCFVEVLVTCEGVKVMRRKPGPEHKARSGFDFPCDLKATTPRFTRYLQDIWGELPDFEARCALLQEFVGGALLGHSTRYHRALMLQGKAGAGKSTLIQIIEGLFPDGAVSHVGPAEFGSDDKFALLATAKLNTLTEASQAAVTAQDRVKSVIEGEWQTVVCKWERAAQFKPTAGHLFAVNTWPSVSGAHASFWDRWICLDMPRRFRDSEAQVLALSEIILNEERAGLVAWAIEGAKRLLAQDKYTVPPSSLAVMDEWKASADSIGIWLATCVTDINEVGIMVKASEAFAAFDKWCQANRFSPMSSRSFGERLSERGVEKHKQSSVFYRMRLMDDGGGLW